MQTVRECARARARMRVCRTGKIFIRQDIKEDALRANLTNSDHTVKGIISNCLKIINRF